MTKTPEASYHNENCPVRIVSDAIFELTKLRSSNERLSGEIGSWERVFDQCCEREAKLRIKLKELEEKLGEGKN
jgi:hypothetical protein